MKTIWIIIISITFITCSNNTTDLETVDKTLVKDILLADEDTTANATKENNNSIDTLPLEKASLNIQSEKITITYPSISLKINDISIMDSNHSSADTVILHPDLGSNIEEKTITINHTTLENVTITQHYETSMAIYDEGPHCDLINWKHYYSTPKPLTSSKNNTFKTHEYSEKERELFPAYTIDELKKEAKKECGDMYNLIKNSKDPKSNVGIGISRYFLTITGTYKNSDKKFIKVIAFVNPMGC